MSQTATDGKSAGFATAIANDPVLAEVVAELANRLAAGDAVDLEEYVARHPDRAESLRQLWPAVRMMADLGQSSHAAATGESSGETDLESGSGVLGDYRLVREIGRGGMGIVYEAEQTLPASARGTEGTAIRCCDRREAAATIPARGPGRRVPASHEHRSGLRRRLRTRGAVLCHAVYRGPQLGPGDRGIEAARRNRGLFACRNRSRRSDRDAGCAPDSELWWTAGGAS